MMPTNDQTENKDKILLKPISDEERKSKNIDGHLGPICTYCSGLGYTMLITGGSQGCRRCDQTGIEPISSQELQRQINEIKSWIAEMVQHLIDEGVVSGIPKKIKEGLENV